MKNVCKKHQPEKDLLFGSAVYKALTETAGNISSLKKVLEKVDQPSSKRSLDNNRQFFLTLLGPQPWLGVEQNLQTVKNQFLDV